MYSPPSPPSPPTPPWVEEARAAARAAAAEAARKARVERERKELYIKLIISNLNKFQRNDRFVGFLSAALQSNMVLEKKYSIATAINGRTENKNLEDETIKKQVRGELREDALNIESSLYGALNYQQNTIAITFFGSQGTVRCNYARTLQTIHSILQEEQPLNGEQKQKYHAIEMNKV